MVTVLPLPLVLSPTLRIIFAATLEGEAMGPLEAIFVQTFLPHPKGTINTNRCSTKLQKTSDIIYQLAKVCNKNGVKLVKDVPWIKFLYQL
jgi:hypothetical protein